MNLLTDILPKSIDVCGVSYPVNTDFRTWIRFEGLIDRLQTEAEQTAVDILKLCFKTEKTAFKLPSSLSETLKALFEFYTGKSLSEETDGTKAKRSRRGYTALSMTANTYMQGLCSSTALIYVKATCTGIGSRLCFLR